MKHGFYVGIREELKGEGALLQSSDDNDVCLAQFDNITRFGNKGEDCLAYGWHKFLWADFKIQDEIAWE